MKLSVCIIARNEESRLAAAIRSVHGLADEVVVTDTGSTDATIQLAESLGARVSRFQWCEDFAAARNACQAQARGEWLFWLDADERLKTGGAGVVRRAIADCGAMAYHVIREDNFSVDRDDWFSEMYQLRLVRRDLPCRWQGRIHEQLTPQPVALAAKLGKAVRASQIRLQHWGYTGDRIPEKLRRAAYLCDLELKERPGQLYYLVELARSLMALNDARGIEVLREATRQMLELRDAPKPPSPLAASLIEQLLAFPGSLGISEDELLILAARWFPRSAPLLWSAARTHALRGRWEDSERDLRRLLELLETGTHDRYMSFDPRIGEDAKVNLGVALIRQGRLDEAQAIFESLLTSDRRAADARTNLHAIATLKAQFGG